MEFELCKMEYDIWLRSYKEDHYAHIFVYVDDLIIASKDPKSAIDVLTNNHSFKIKGKGPISCHLGCDFGHDDDGTLYFEPKNHIETMVGYYYNMLDTKTKLSFYSPLEKGDHPELCTSENIDSDSGQKHQSMIGTIISLGTLDVNTVSM